MKLTNTFDAVTISTRLTQDQLSKAHKYAPESLTLMDDKKPIFAIVEGCCGSVNKNGIVFANADRTGALYVTVTNDRIAALPEAETRTILEEEFGIILFRLKQIEDQVELAVGIAAETIASVAASIVIG